MNIEDLKATIYQRDGKCCQYCGKSRGVTFVVEHVVPEARGGHTGPDNLVIACGSCNSIKRSSTWVPRNLDTLAALNPLWASTIQLYATMDRLDPPSVGSQRKPVSWHIDRELLEEFREYCAVRNQPQNLILEDFIQRYMQEMG